MQLKDLKIGQSAKLVSFGNLDNALKKRLISLGLHKNATLTLDRRAPLGDPVQISIKQTSFSIRVADVAELSIEVLA